MAWFTEQILSDFLNLNNNHTGAAKALAAILDEGVSLTLDSASYHGRAEVIAQLEEAFAVFSSEPGCYACPVVTRDAAENRKNAVALFRKMDGPVLRLYLVSTSPETWLISRIEAKAPDGYDMYYDRYEQADYDDEGNRLMN